MLGPTKLWMAAGFAMFCVGGAAHVYMDFALNGIKMAYDIRRGSPEFRYWKLIKERRASVWPFLLSVVFIPLGFAIMVASIIWSNHLRR